MVWNCVVFLKYLPKWQSLLLLIPLSTSFCEEMFNNLQIDCFQCIVPIYLQMIEASNKSHRYLISGWWTWRSQLYYNLNNMKSMFAFFLFPKVSLTITWRAVQCVDMQLFIFYLQLRSSFTKAFTTNKKKNRNGSLSDCEMDTNSLRSTLSVPNSPLLQIHMQNGQHPLIKGSHSSGA